MGNSQAERSKRHKGTGGGAHPHLRPCLVQMHACMHASSSRRLPGASLDRPRLSIWTQDGLPAAWLRPRPRRLSATRCQSHLSQKISPTGMARERGQRAGGTGSPGRCWCDERCRPRQSHAEPETGRLSASLRRELAEFSRHQIVKRVHRRVEQEGGETLAADVM